MPKVTMVDVKNKRVIIDKLDIDLEDNDFVIDLYIKAKYKGYALTVDYSDF